MTPSNQTQNAASASLKVEAIALLGTACVCLLIYLSLIVVLIISSGKVAKAPAVPPDKISAPNH